MPPGWLPFCCPLSLPSPQVPRAPLAGVPTQCPLLDSLWPEPLPRLAAATAAHRDSPIWSPALTFHGRLVRHPPSPGHVLEEGGLEAQRGVCGQELSVGADRETPKEKKREQGLSEANRNRGERGVGRRWRERQREKRVSGWKARMRGSDKKCVAGRREAGAKRREGARGRCRERQGWRAEKEEGEGGGGGQSDREGLCHRW